MNKNKLAGHLAALEALKSDDSSERIYDDWSREYDQNLTGDYQYIAPQIAVDAFCANTQQTDCAIVDYGCGTGIVGELLAARGFECLDGMDISAGMLSVARTKKVYRHLVKADLTRPIAIDDGHYDSMICVGSFAAGHLHPAHLDEMLRTVRSQGLVVLFLNEQFYLKEDYPDHFRRLETRGIWQIHVQERHNYMASLDRPGWLVVATRR